MSCTVYLKKPTYETELAEIYQIERLEVFEAKVLLGRSKTQIREQMYGPEISYYEKSILGCGLWSGLDCQIKGFGPIMSN